jgi:succinate dehydrogenase / fumarate reductase cytochrome b subunit
VREKPVYLNLFTFAFPITAIVSILHRISGVVVFFCIPLLLACLQNLLYAPSALPNCSFVAWLILSAFIYHLLAGIRHILMDCGYFENLTQARASSFIVLALAIICSLLLGYKLC